MKVLIIQEMPAYEEILLFETDCLRAVTLSMYTMFGQMAFVHTNIIFLVIKGN